MHKRVKIDLKINRDEYKKSKNSKSNSSGFTGIFRRIQEFLFINFRFKGKKKRKNNSKEVKNAQKENNPTIRLLYSLQKLTIILGIFSIISMNGIAILQIEVLSASINQSFSQVAGTGIEVINQNWEPELRATDNYTGFLIMGIDSRDVQFTGTEFLGKDRDIDSILQVVINNETGELLTISLPRDIGVTSPYNCIDQNSIYFRSINHIYKLAEDGNCEESGGEMMMKHVTLITGFENHYFSIISYDTFREVINTVGEEVDEKKGLYIDVPRNTLEYYPIENGYGFERVYWPAGYQFIDSIDLLKYARSRKNSSDFDRAGRQQQVLSALKSKVLSDATLNNPQKILELYNQFSEGALFTELTLTDIRGLIYQAQNLDFETQVKVVLDDTFGGTKNKFLTKPTYSNGLHSRAGYYLSPTAFNKQICVEQNDEYCEVKAELKNIFDNPQLYAEQPDIFTYSNVRGISPETDDYLLIINQFEGEVTTSRFSLDLDTDKDVVIYDYSNGNFPITAERLSNLFNIELIPGEEAPFDRLNADDFVIIVNVD